MSRAEYARLRALVDLRLGELREALDRHEADLRLDDTDALVRIDSGLQQVLRELVQPPAFADPKRLAGDARR